MAQRLLAAGHELTVWNRDGAKAGALVTHGAKLGTAPGDAARAGVVLTMLADDEALEAVVRGKGGILSAGTDLLHISCSTVSVSLTRTLMEDHERVGQRFASAQVLGRPDAAAAGQLVIVAAGHAADLDTARPLFEAIGSKTVCMGAVPTMAAATKLAANFGIATLIEMMTEQMRIASVNGIDATRFADFLDETNFGSRYLSVYAPIIAQQQFEPARMNMRLGRKDVGLALDAAQGAALPVAELLALRMDRAIDAGEAALDWAALGQNRTSQDPLA
jgi:3-hydroxyisobutyrate dehydrogenase-like beta-hydroxyacid dehydrogenase